MYKQSVGINLLCGNTVNTPRISVFKSWIRSKNTHTILHIKMIPFVILTVYLNNAASSFIIIVIYMYIYINTDVNVVIWMTTFDLNPFRMFIHAFGLVRWLVSFKDEQEISQRYSLSFCLCLCLFLIFASWRNSIEPMIFYLLIIFAHVQKPCRSFSHTKR